MTTKVTAMPTSAKTKFMENVEAAGGRAVNGLNMLLYQGAEAFRLWTGKEMPVDVDQGEILFRIMYSSAIIHKIYIFHLIQLYFITIFNIFKKGAASHSSAFLLYGNHFLIYPGFSGSKNVSAGFRLPCEVLFRIYPAVSSRSVFREDPYRIYCFPDQ